MFSNSEFTTEISPRERYSLFFINVLTYGTYGILGGSFGVALQTIKRVFGLTLDEVSSGLALQAVGGVVSAILATFFLDKFNRQIQYFWITLILGFLVILFPFLSGFPFFVFLIINLAIGFFCTLIDCISNAWVVELFRPKEHIFIQILHFFYSSGSLISPLIFGPYLDKKNLTLPKTDNINETDEFYSTGNQLDEKLNKDFVSKLPVSFQYLSDQIEKSDIWIPLFFLGAFIVFCSILHWVAYFIKPYKEINKKALKEVPIEDLNNNSNLEKSSNNLINDHDNHLNKSKNLSTSYYILFVVLIVIIVDFEVTNEVNATNFLPTFLEKSNLGLDQENSGYVFLIFQTVIAVVRFLNILLSFKLNTVLNLYFNFISMVIGSIILLTFSQTSLMATKIGVVLLGFGFSSTYPLIITFVEKRITLTNKISSIMAFSSVWGLIISPFLITPFLEKNPISFVYFTFGYTIISVICFTTLYVLEILRLRKLF